LPFIKAKEISLRRNKRSANLAQLVEHFIRNERVVGSIPIVGSKMSPFSANYFPGGSNRLFQWAGLTILVLYLVSCFAPLRLESDSLHYFAIKDCLEYGCPPDFLAAKGNRPYGYPMLLLILSKMGILRSFFIAFINGLYLLGGLYFVQRIFGRTLHPLLFFSVILLNWIFIKIFAYPLSDMQYLFLSTGSLYCFSRYRQQRRIAMLVSAFAFAGLAFLTRTVGISLAPVLLAGVAWEHKNALKKNIRRNGLWILSVLLLIIVLLLVFSKFLGLDHYMDVLSRQRQGGAGAGEVILRHLEEWGQLFLNVPLGKIGVYLPGRAAEGLTLLAGICIFALILYIFLLRQAAIPLFIIIYLVTYSLIIFNWPFYDPRFWVPVLPLVTAIILQAPLYKVSFGKAAGYIVFVVYCLMGGVAVGYSLFTEFNKKAFARTQAKGIYRNEYETYFFGKPLSDTATHIDPYVLHVLKSYD
jgi:hypothetical protein